MFGSRFGWRGLGSFAIAAWAVVVVLPNQARAARLLSIGPNTLATRVSADGLVVVGQDLSGVPGEPRGYRWTETGGLVQIGLSSTPGPFPTSEANAVSADGSVIVGFCTVGTANQAFRWTQATGIVPLGSLPGETNSVAYAVSGDGKVVAGVTGQGYSFRWTQADGMTALSAIGGEFDRANGLTQDGSVIVGRVTGIPTNHGFRWTSATGSVLIDAPGQIPPSEATAITSDGNVMVGYNYALTGNSAFRWTQAGGFVSLDPAGDQGTETHPDAVSSDGSQIVGDWHPPGMDQQAFLWDSTHGIESLEDRLTALGVDLTGWSLTEATAISADGTVIVGNGIHNGVSEGFYAQLVPEPSALGVVAASGWALLPRRRRAVC